jgi:hypothetical protein
MKTPKPPPPELDPGMEIELGRRRARDYVHDATDVLYDLLPRLKDLEARKTLTEIIGELSTQERRLKDLEADHRSDKSLLTYFVEARFRDGHTSAILYEADPSIALTETTRIAELAGERNDARLCQLFCLDYWAHALIAPLENERAETH